MKKITKIILAIFALLIIGLVVKLQFPSAVGVVYLGSVKINPIILTDVENKLLQVECGSYYDYNMQCRYSKGQMPTPYIDIYYAPFGDRFTIMEDKILATKKMAVSSNQNQFKELVRKTIKDLGNIVQIQEDSWNIKENKVYPEGILSH